MAKYYVPAMGQSNQSGINSGAQISVIANLKQVSRGVDRGGYAFGSDGDIIDALHQLQHASFNTSEGPTPHGPAIAYCRELLGSDEFCIVPTAKGGDSLSTYWADGQTGYTDTETRSGIAELAGYTLHSMIWLHGESDATNLSYAEELYQFITAIRSDIGNVPFIAAGIIELGSDQEETNAVIVEVLRHFDNTAFVDTSDLTTGNSGNHFGADNIETIGVRMAAAFSVAQSYQYSRHSYCVDEFDFNNRVDPGATFTWHNGVSGSAALTQATASNQPTNERSNGLAFDGDDWIDRASDISIANGVTRIIRFSIDTLGATHFLFDSTGGDDLRVKANNRLSFDTISQVNALGGTTTLAADSEYTVAVTHSSDGTMQMWLSTGGDFVSEGTANFALTQGTALRVGSRDIDTDGTYAMTGKLKNFRQYSSSLTEHELNNERRRLDNESLLSSLIGHYELDESAGTTAIDSSGTANNGTYTNTTAEVSDVDGLAPNSGRAKSFSGDEFINLGDTIDTTSDLSVMAWLHVTSSTEIGGVASRWNSGQGWLVLVFNGKIRAYRDGEFVQTVADYPLVPFHLAVTYEGTSVKIYFDAVEQATTGTISSVTHTLAAGTDTQIGSYTNSASAGVNLLGTIDDVRIYNEAVEQSVVEEIYADLTATGTAALRRSPISHPVGSPVGQSTRLHPAIRGRFR